MKLDVFDAKGSPDWRKFALVADRTRSGSPRPGTACRWRSCWARCKEISRDVEDRYHRLSEMPTDVCPEGKLTREIARDPRYACPSGSWCWRSSRSIFDVGEASKEIASLLVFLVKVAPGRRGDPDRRHAAAVRGRHRARSPSSSPRSATTTRSGSGCVPRAGRSPSCASAPGPTPRAWTRPRCCRSTRASGSCAAPRTPRRPSGPTSPTGRTPSGS